LAFFKDALQAAHNAPHKTDTLGEWQSGRVVEEEKKGGGCVTLLAGTRC
jgi:hypothetical protein